ncbi:hypothetical protein BDZ94DRAFT_1230236 [Collybia nuda]|uniref:Uncharacterized protein n=1 Tax=Collybia nuda TaxID=64659 RepID=A0A9P5XT37_9AGAR|nr:hypothetical protein BDZ94DRAFT_1230236 [Collybia nuda]
MATTGTGLLFVLAECGPKVSEIEFNAWYDDEHAPARLTVPGFTSAARYKSIDSKTPSWVAIYDMDSTDVVFSEAYAALRTNASENERSIISRLALLNRRIYNHMTTVESPHFDPNSSAEFILAVYMQPTADDEVDFNQWYNEEHLDMLSKVPGFQRARRFKLISHVELAGKVNPLLAKTPTSYLTVYEWDSDSYKDTPEFASALATPWSVQVFAKVTELDMGLFKIHKSFSR